MLGLTLPRGANNAPTQYEALLQEDLRRHDFYEGSPRIHPKGSRLVSSTVLARRP